MCGTLLCTAIIGSEYIRLASHVPGSVVHVVMWHTGLYLALYLCLDVYVCLCYVHTNLVVCISPRV